MTVKQLRIRALTPKQKAIVDFISNYHKRHGYSPSLEEIADEFDLSAVSTVHQHIKLIRKKGYLQKDDFQPRSVLPLEQAPNIIEVPILGKIPAGQPIEVYREPEPVRVPTSLIKNPTEHYALEVDGDSMIEDDVWDGDIILIKHQPTANVGDMVVAVADNLVTLKRFGGVENGRVKLIPRNPKLKPLFVDPENFEIRGKFAGLLRQAQKRQK